MGIPGVARSRVGIRRRCGNFSWGAETPKPYLIPCGTGHRFLWPVKPAAAGQRATKRLLADSRESVLQKHFGSGDFVGGVAPHEFDDKGEGVVQEFVEFVDGHIAHADEGRPVRGAYVLAVAQIV